MPSKRYARDGKDHIKLQNFVDHSSERRRKEIKMISIERELIANASRVSESKKVSR
jgi:hypothetical protein